MNSSNFTTWGRVAISVLSLVTFVGALIVSAITKNETMLSLTVGAAVANATTVVNWWLGSSSGSEKKDDIIAHSTPNEKVSDPEKAPSTTSSPPPSPPLTV